MPKAKVITKSKVEKLESIKHDLQVNAQYMSCEDGWCDIANTSQNTIDEAQEKIRQYRKKYSYGTDEFRIVAQQVTTTILSVTFKG